MTEEKKSKNPFIEMAKQAKKNGNPFNNQHQNKIPKPNKGFGGATVVRRTGRGG